MEAPQPQSKNIEIFSVPLHEAITSPFVLNDPDVIKYDPGVKLEVLRALRQLFRLEREFIEVLILDVQHEAAIWLAIIVIYGNLKIMLLDHVSDWIRLFLMRCVFITRFNCGLSIDMN